MEYVQWRKKVGQQVLGHPLWMDVYAGEYHYNREYQMGIIPPDVNDFLPEIDRRLHRKLGAPILWKYKKDINGGPSLVMPLLANISGFSGLYPAEKIYRDIYNFLLAQKSSPDANPPVSVDNAAKIAKHGFDIKKSFRHPVNARPKRRKAK